ncbi:Retrovirus-related Pol polyprotein [Stylophora pistillata]|uniref:Retrovirus-related Pol polyprotein n=1 Tax=Stylophora pistillata TaxID=50429 RepID=A0A2B4R1H8_STYPI|nr:Retrovirus-related Pol polyprotein [Stylophora pistillata]
MASGFSLPPPPPLDIHDHSASEKWKKFELAWRNYALVTELNKRAEPVQVTTLLTVIGGEARDVYSTFTGWGEGENQKIEPVLRKFAEYCEPRRNVPFERYRFNQRMQEAGESYDHYKTSLRKLPEGCDFNTITLEEILRDRLIFGINDGKVRERLLREAGLTLAKTDEICRAAESMRAQMKMVGEIGDCRLVDNNDIRPILGRKACIGMGVVVYQDNDHPNKPETGTAPVYAVQAQDTVLSKEELVTKFPKVFTEGVGDLDGEYKIRLDPTVQPVQHAPRRVAVALRPKLKETLDDLVTQEVIAPVTEPTEWTSSIVIAPKKNGQLRVCLDPKDLNCAIRREKYEMPTIEDIATRFHRAKVFTVLDVRNGFWHVSLDEQSSYLTTFQTPFGRYRWRRMPFGISSAPEVFQRKMHELIEGLTGIEVVADDFIAVGYGETYEEASRDHDRNLLAFLERCDERNVRLNPEKIKLRQSEVLFIGHVASDKGLQVDPAKVRAMTEMLVPTDKAAVQRLLGLAQYLAKFLPHLSDITKPLRDLTQRDVDWVWGSTHQAAFEKLKEAVTKTPVLRYYNFKEEVTLQCDASQSGLGATLMQQGQPVAYASRAPTPAETRYAQIEKELLAIVFACDRFDAYIYGRHQVTVETDHKPLEPIFSKPLASAPQRLQRMLMRLQKYNL